MGHYVGQNITALKEKSETQEMDRGGLWSEKDKDANLVRVRLNTPEKLRNLHGDGETTIVTISTMTKYSSKVQAHLHNIAGINVQVNESVKQQTNSGAFFTDFTGTFLCAAI